eukprot:TRINITY_DN2464_c0_g1_i1.p1 TRINITY_DN2464_c0_g1~~TRINITY_DN2464_c0_g1_i1.p1  ORF type:complete len:243 (+),score=75.04 TRINITY_DN2464_c0_g1_i1:82-810(+)
MGWGGKGKTGGWKQTWQPTWNKNTDSGQGWGKQNDFMRNAPAEKKVWLGGLPAESTSVDLNKAVKEHLMKAGSCKYAEVGKTGVGCAIFGSAEEALNAVEMLNGSRFRGRAIEVDVWTSESPQNGGFKKTWQPAQIKAWQPSGNKGSGKGWGKQNSDFMRNAPAEKKVWLGGLPEGATGVDVNKAIKEHLMQAGSCKYAEVGKRGVGCALFGSAEDAAAAIDTLNGSIFDGSVLQVDVWTKQ